MFEKLKLYLRETSDLSRLFDESNRRARRIVFYSERDIYYQYFEGLFETLLTESDVEVCYLTSDPDDPLFHRNNARMKVFYIRQLLGTALQRLDATVLIMTMPDLHHFHIKRSPRTQHHVYLFHALVSAHLQYRTRAFEHYDTIFCCGPHHVRELRREEELYGFKARTLVESGYHRLEKIYRDHQDYRNRNAGYGNRKRILVAPTWGSSSVLEICPDELVRVLASVEYDVVIRPHPEFLKREPGKAERLRRTIAGTRNMTFETDMLSDASLHSADVLITDRSGIAFEYAFGTERPALFIDTPPKINNPEYEKLGVEPIENSARSSMGMTVPVGELDRIPMVLQDFSGQEARFRERIRECRARTVFNWLESAKVEAEYMVNLIRN